MTCLFISRLIILSLLVPAIAFPQLNAPNIEVRVSGSYNQSEAWCAIDPVHPDNIAAVWHDRGLDPALPSDESGAFAISTDRGMTWTLRPFIPTEYSQYHFMADPSVYVDRNGNIFSCSIVAGSAIPQNAWQIGLITRKFENDDAIVTEITPAAGYDRPQLSIDNHIGSSTSGRIFVTYYKFIGPDTKYGFKYSTNGGVSFSPEQIVSLNPPASQPPEVVNCLSSVSIPAAGSNGMVAVAYNDNNSSSIAIKVGIPDESGSYSFTEGTPIPVPLGCLSTFGGLNAATYPMMVVDNNNFIHLVYSNNSASGKWQIYYKKSVDLGDTWISYPTPLGDFTGGNTIQPTIAVDEDNAISISFYHVTEDNDIDYYVAKSYDAGESITKPIRISGTSSDGSLTGFMGDYQGISSHPEYDYAIWSDNRNGNSDIYGAMIINYPMSSANSKWNLVGVPLSVDTYPPPYYSDLVWSERDPAILPWGWTTTGYFEAVDIYPKAGYWLRVPDLYIHNYVGKAFENDSVTVNSGWNLIGSISLPSTLDDPSGIFVAGPYGFNSGYYYADNIEPGRGYWVKVSGDGSLIFNDHHGSQPPGQTQNPPVAPGFPSTTVLLAPDSASTNQLPSLTFSWYPTSGAQTYQFQLSTSSTFSSFIVNDSTLSTNSRTVSGLAYSTIYYWRVRGINEEGTGYWSNTWPLTTTTPPPQPPPAPTLASPSNGATNQNTQLYLTWNSSAGASKYRVQLSRYSNFSSTVLDDQNVTQTSRFVTSLLYSTTYYWRVAAWNTAGWSSWSSVWHFTTKSAPPPDPCDPYSAIAQLDMITIADSTGISQTVFIRNGARGLGQGLRRGEMMPPEPPPGLFHARFHSGKFIEAVNPGNGKNIMPLHLKDATYPLTISWNLRDENLIDYWLEFHGPGNPDRTHLSGQGQKIVNNPGNGNKPLIIEAQAPDPCDPQTKTVIRGEVKEDIEDVPGAFALRQNYPNPFNPTTRIYYDLPEPAHVSIVLYNMLGQQVLTLVDEIQGAGFKSVELDLKSFPSGVYVYRLQSGGFNDFKKMVLIK